VNRTHAMTHSSSEMQLRLALAIVILGFEERVDKQTRELLELEQAIQQLIRQREALQEQRTKDTDYLAESMRQLYPDLSLTVSGEGRVEIPSGVLQQLQQLQQAQNTSFPAPAGLHGREHVSDEHLPEVPADALLGTPATFLPAAIAGEAPDKTDIDARAKAVLVYVFSQPQEAVLDWKTTIQRALDLPEPPKMRGHTVYKAVQQAYRIIESLHDGNTAHPSDALLKFYTQYFIEGERWADFKDTMSEWGVSL